MNRRLPVLVALVASLVGAGFLASDHPSVSSSGTFAVLHSPTTPYVPLTDRLTSTFYCAGVPAAADGRGGDVIVVNPTDTAKSGAVTAFGINGPAGRQDFEIAPRSSWTYDLGGLAPEGYVESIVEMRGSGVVVEQRAQVDATTTVAPCGADASDHWILAAGSTLGDKYDLVLSNPFPDAAVVDLRFVTASDTRSPNEFQNYVIPAQSVRSIAVDQVARDEAQLTIDVTSRRGRLVVGRAQQFGGEGRDGASVSLAAPAAGHQWLFADGELSDQIPESYTIFNPGDQAASVDVTFFPLTPPSDQVVAPVSVEVPAGRAVALASSSFGLPFSGRYGVSVAAAGDATIVVEQTITRGSSGTSMVLGARFGSGRWWAPSGVPGATSGALVVFNASGLSGTVSVSALGPGGVKALPGLDQVPLAAASLVTIDIPAEAAGAPLLVQSADLSLVVEQRNAGGAGRRTGALGIPE